MQATNLAPADANGKADPYLVVQIGHHVHDTKDRYLPKQLNPTFGESVPITVPVPGQHTATVRLTSCFSYTAFQGV